MFYQEVEEEYHQRGLCSLRHLPELLKKWVFFIKDSKLVKIYLKNKPPQLEIFLLLRPELDLLAAVKQPQRTSANWINQQL